MASRNNIPKIYMDDEENAVPRAGWKSISIVGNGRSSTSGLMRPTHHEASGILAITVCSSGFRMSDIAQHGPQASDVQHTEIEQAMHSAARKKREKYSMTSNNSKP